jgi:hypothetical protein
MFTTLDLASGRLLHRFRHRKRAQEFRDFCRQLRRRFPPGAALPDLRQQRRTPRAAVHTWCPDHHIELVFTSVQRVRAELDSPSTSPRTPHPAPSSSSCLAGFSQVTPLTEVSASTTSSLSSRITHTVEPSEPAGGVGVTQR